MGTALLLPFFATIGAAAGSLDALSDVGWLFCLIAVQLITHLVVIICGGRLLQLPMDAVLTASNANVGGPATAAATAAVRNWPHLVQPGVLTGTLGCVLVASACVSVRRCVSSLRHRHEVLHFQTRRLDVTIISMLTIHLTCAGMPWEPP
jgi:uncharacterized membrane protein